MMSTDKKPYGTDDNSYISAGKIDGIKKLVDAFYHYMDTQDSASGIRNMHAKNLDVVKEKLTLFLCGWLGGPKLFQEKFGSISIPQFHKNFPIGEAERDAWLTCMKMAANDQDYTDDFKTYLLEQLYVPAERIRMVSNQPKT